jgi:hypothetical protein
MHLECGQLSADHMHILARLNKLRTLWFTRSSTRSVKGEVGLRYLTDMQRLADLRISGLTDDGVPTLARLMNLQRLSLPNHQIDGEELKMLQSLPNLTRLDER